MKVIVTAVLVCLVGITLFAQAPQGSSPAQTTAQATNQTNQGDTRMMQHMEEMETMAKSMISMADMCRMMMEKEMRNYPLKIGAIVAAGSLFTIALILFIVLEIQWIRFWSVRIKTERLKLNGLKP